MFDSPSEFAQYFYHVFMQPLISLLKDTDIMGFSLFSWLLGLAVFSMAVGFIRAFFGHGQGKE